MQRRVVFRGKLLPYLLLAPQLAVTLMFFFWPAGQAIWQSLHREDPFGLSSRFVGIDNFTAVLADPSYLHSLGVTAAFSVAVTVLAVAPSLLLAVMADRGLRWLGIDWNYLLDGTQALALVVIAAAWKQISYNFLFFLAGLQSIPKSLLEAASIDGANGSRRFWTIILPLLSPTTFFLIVVDVVYAFFDTFGIVHAVTAGGPAKATEILVYKVFYDGVVALDLGGSAAQSVILMVIVIALTAVQFRFVERRVHYG